MGKGQANKPDFVRDINTAIMEELTAGGIKDNAAGLAGELKEIEEVTELCGLRFNGYLAKIETPRPRGTLDEVIVAFTREAAGAKGDITIEAIRENLIGSKVIAAGVVQTLKDFESGKVLVFILADFIRTAKSPMMQDDVALRGIIAHEPIYRTTPRGKRITDISVIVKNELTGNKCFIPCICWQEQADEVAGWQQGDTVELLGRYQSRQYEKVIDTDSGSRERRTAYEVSVQLINRKGRQEMRVKTIVNSKGEPQATEIAIPIEGAGGELGKRAVINLTSLISGLKSMKTEQDIVTHYHIICGFASCCETCGFMTEKSTNDLMHMVEHLVENELARVAANDSP